MKKEITPEALFAAYQNADEKDKEKFRELFNANSTPTEEDIKEILIKLLNGEVVLFNEAPDAAPLVEWVNKASVTAPPLPEPLDLKPRYVKGKGIYVPVVGKYLAMQDRFNRAEVDWDNAVKGGAPTRDEWYIILFFRDEINRLLRENCGKELGKWYWTSTESTQSYAWSVGASDGNVYLFNKSARLSVRAWAASE